MKLFSILVLLSSFVSSALAAAPTKAPTKVPTASPSALKGFLVASQQVDNVAYSDYLTNPSLYKDIFNSAVYTAAGVSEPVIDLQVSSAGTSGEAVTLTYSLVWHQEYWSYDQVSTILNQFSQTGRFGSILQGYARQAGYPSLFPHASSPGVTTTDTTPPSAITLVPTKAPTKKPTATPTLAPTALTASMQVTQIVNNVAYADYLTNPSTYDSVFTSVGYLSSVVVNTIQFVQASDANRRLTGKGAASSMNLRVRPVTTAIGDAIELQYTLQWRQEYWSYAQVSSYLTYFVQTGRYNALLQVYARQAGYPSLFPDAQSNSVVTQDLTVYA